MGYRMDNKQFQNQFGFDPKFIKYILGGLAIFILFIVLTGSTYVVQPGARGVAVTLGNVSPQFLPEGFGFKAPFITTIIPISVRTQNKTVKAECYSSDLQQVNTDLRVLYRIPEASVVKIYQEFMGDPFETLVAPRVAEALKEVTAGQSAKSIVKNREEIKIKALAAAKIKIAGVLIVEDLVILNISLSQELEQAIEQKMVQEQEAAKAKFTQQKAQIEANTAIIRAKGEAESIQIRGRALRESPSFIQLQIVEKWDGKSPQVVGGGATGANILLPIGTKSGM